MAKRKPKESAMGTSLGDLLFQKNVKCEDGTDQGGRIAELEREKSVLEERVRQMEERCGTLDQSNENLLEELNHRNTRITVLEREKEALASSLFERAVKELREGSFLQGLGFLQAVLIHEPGNLKAMINLAVVYAELGFHDMAVDTLEQVLSRDPHSEIALRNLNILKNEL